MTKPALCKTCTHGMPGLCLYASQSTGRGSCRDALCNYERGEHAERERWTSACQSAGCLLDVMAVLSAGAPS